MKIGAKIRELRISRNMTQEQLAEKLFVSFQTISKWETETTNPDLTQIVRIARLFQVTTDELFDFNESTENFRHFWVDNYSSKRGMFKNELMLAEKHSKNIPTIWNGESDMRGTFGVLRLKIRMINCFHWKGIKPLNFLKV